MGVDNTLAPHGGPYAKRVLSPDEAPGAFTGLTQVPSSTNPGETVTLLQ
jgi:hypothetical protein